MADRSQRSVVRLGLVLLCPTGTHNTQHSEKNKNDCGPRHRKHAENREQHQCKTLLERFRVPKEVPGCLITCVVARVVARK